MKRVGLKKDRRILVFFIGIVIVSFLGLKSYINGQHHLAEVKYNYLVDQIKKEKSDYWNLKSKIDVMVDKRLEKDKQLSSRLKKVDKQEVSRVVFEQ